MSLEHWEASIHLAECRVYDVLDKYVQKEAQVLQHWFDMAKKDPYYHLPSNQKLESYEVRAEDYYKRIRISMSLKHRNTERAMTEEQWAYNKVLLQYQSFAPFIHQVEFVKYHN